MITEVFDHAERKADHHKAENEVQKNQTEAKRKRSFLVSWTK